MKAAPCNNRDLRHCKAIADTQCEAECRQKASTLARALKEPPRYVRSMYAPLAFTLFQRQAALSA